MIFILITNLMQATVFIFQIILDFIMHIFNYSFCYICLFIVESKRKAVHLKYLKPKSNIYSSCLIFCENLTQQMKKIRILARIYRIWVLFNFVQRQAVSGSSFKLYICSVLIINTIHKITDAIRVLLHCILKVSLSVFATH